MAFALPVDGIAPGAAVVPGVSPTRTAMNRLALPRLTWRAATP